MIRPDRVFLLESGQTQLVDRAQALLDQVNDHHRRANPSSLRPKTKHILSITAPGFGSGPGTAYRRNDDHGEDHPALDQKGKATIGPSFVDVVRLLSKVAVCPLFGF